MRRPSASRTLGEAPHNREAFHGLTLGVPRPHARRHTTSREALRGHGVLHKVAHGLKASHEASGNCRASHKVDHDLEASCEASDGCMTSHNASGGCRALHEASSGYRALYKTSGGCRDSHEASNGRGRPPMRHRGRVPTFVPCRSTNEIKFFEQNEIFRPCRLVRDGILNHAVNCIIRSPTILVVTNPPRRQNEASLSAKLEPKHMQSFMCKNS